MRIPGTVAFVMLIFLALTDSVRATTCLELALLPQLLADDHVSLVFQGTVIDRQPVSLPRPWTGSITTFEVTRVWKGQLARRSRSISANHCQIMRPNCARTFSWSPACRVHGNVSSGVYRQRGADIRHICVWHLPIRVANGAQDHRGSSRRIASITRLTDECPCISNHRGKRLLSRSEVQRSLPRVEWPLGLAPL